MSEQGIDLSRSGWENPEGFKPRQRDNVPVPEVPEVCGDVGPNGWVCEMPPGHDRYQHWADNGTNEGVTWEREKVEVTSHGAMVRGEQEFIPGRIMTTAMMNPNVDLDEIRSIAEKALQSQAPAVWAVALAKIQEMVS